MSDPTTLAAIAAAAQRDHRARLASSAEAADEAQTNVNRIALAEVLIEAEVPENALVDYIEWADEPTADGLFDLNVTEAYLPDGEVVANLGGYEAFAAGRPDGSTDWDIFKPTDDPRASRIEVAKVYGWLRSQADQSDR